MILLDAPSHPFNFRDSFRHKESPASAAARSKSGGCLNNKAAAILESGRCLIDQAAARFKSCSCLVDQALVTQYVSTKDTINEH